VRLEELGELKKIHVIGTQTRDLPACSIVEMGEEVGQNQSATNFYGGTRQRS
jgi:hypothetical protein